MASTQMSLSIDPSNSIAFNHKEEQTTNNSELFSMSRNLRPKADDPPMKSEFFEEESPCSLVEARTTECSKFYAGLELCVICNSSGLIPALDESGTPYLSDEHTLYCHDCGECYHMFCMSPPLSKKTFIKPSAEEWRCSYCKFCVICQVDDTSTDEDTDLVVCDRCDRCFHIECALLTEEEVDGENWLCSDCRFCSNCHKHFDYPPDSTPTNHRYAFCETCQIQYSKKIEILIEKLKSKPDFLDEEDIQFDDTCANISEEECSSKSKIQMRHYSRQNESGLPPTKVRKIRANQLPGRSSNGTNTLNSLTSSLNSSSINIEEINKHYQAEKGGENEIIQQVHRLPFSFPTPQYHTSTLPFTTNQPNIPDHIKYVPRHAQKMSVQMNAKNPADFNPINRQQPPNVYQYASRSHSMNLQNLDPTHTLHSQQQINPNWNTNESSSRTAPYHRDMKLHHPSTPLSLNQQSGFPQFVSKPQTTEQFLHPRNSISFHPQPFSNPDDIDTYNQYLPVSLHSTDSTHNNSSFNHRNNSNFNTSSMVFPDYPNHPNQNYQNNHGYRNRCGETNDQYDRVNQQMQALSLPLPPQSPSNSSLPNHIPPHYSTVPPTMPRTSLPNGYHFASGTASMTSQQPQQPQQQSLEQAQTYHISKALSIPSYPPPHLQAPFGDAFGEKLFLQIDPIRGLQTHDNPVIVVGEGGPPSFNNPNPEPKWMQVFEMTLQAFQEISTFFRDITTCPTPIYVIPAGYFPIVDQCPSPRMIMSVLATSIHALTRLPYQLPPRAPVPSGTMFLPPRSIPVPPNPTLAMSPQFSTFSNSFSASYPASNSLPPSLPHLNSHAPAPVQAPSYHFNNRNNMYRPVRRQSPPSPPPHTFHTQQQISGQSQPPSELYHHQIHPKSQYTHYQQHYSHLNQPQQQKQHHSQGADRQDNLELANQMSGSSSNGRKITKQTNQTNPQKMVNKRKRKVRDHEYRVDGNNEANYDSDSSSSSSSSLDSSPKPQARSKRKGMRPLLQNSKKASIAALENGPPQMYLMSLSVSDLDAIDISKIARSPCYYVGYVVPNSNNESKFHQYHPIGDLIKNLAILPDKVSFQNAPVRADDDRKCSACGLIGDRAISGRLIPMQLVNQWIHANCALWSHGSKEYEDGEVSHCFAALSRSKSLLCTHCNLAVATITCHAARCATRYHLHCAIEAGCKFGIDGNLRYVFCSSHLSRYVWAIGNENSPSSYLGAEKPNNIHYNNNNNPSFSSNNFYSAFISNRRVHVGLEEVSLIKREQNVSADEWTSYYFRSGALTVRSLGYITHLFKFRTKNNIYPCQYKASRIFWSWKVNDPNNLYTRCLYHFFIEDGDVKPYFVIECSEDPANPIRTQDTQSAWIEVVKRVNNARMWAINNHDLNNMNSNDNSSNNIIHNNGSYGARTKSPKSPCSTNSNEMDIADSASTESTISSKNNMEVISDPNHSSSSSNSSIISNINKNSNSSSNNSINHDHDHLQDLNGNGGISSNFHEPKPSPSVSPVQTISGIAISSSSSSSSPIEFTPISIQMASDFFFGLNVRHIRSHIERLPGALDLDRYIRRFDEVIRIPSILYDTVVRITSDDPHAYDNFPSSIQEGSDPQFMECARTRPYYPLSSQERFKYADAFSFHPSQATEEYARREKQLAKWGQSMYPQDSSSDLISFIRSGVLYPSISQRSTRYRQMKKSEKIRLKVLRSKIQGWGLFVMEDVVEGEYLIEYVGEVISNKLADKREKEYQSKGIGCYMFRLDESNVIDATLKGNTSRFINHSCEPNCGTDVQISDKQPKIIIFAKQDIKRGEELTYDYCFQPEEEKLVCHCGAKQCRGTMN